MQLIKVSVADSLGWDFYLPDASISLFQTIGLHSLPLVKSANQKDLSGIGCPLAQYPTFIRSVQSEPKVAGSKVGEGDLPILCEIGEAFQVIGVTSFNSFVEGS